MDSRANLFESQNLRDMESRLAIAQKQKNEIKVTTKPAIQQWDNPIEFLMTCIGYAVGIGGVIRFPYLCFKNGGCAFVVAFLIMLMFFGIPLFFLELTISQYSKLGADKVWRVIPIFKGLGLCSVVINTYFCIYFNVLISYSVIYLIASFFPNIPWIGCNNWWNDNLCLSSASATMIMSGTNATNATNHTESASEQFFYNFVLEMSTGIDDINGVNFKVVGSLLLLWILAFFALVKGIQSLGKVSYFTAIFPYVMITVLIIRGVTLPGAQKGLEFYIYNVNMAKLTEVQTWIDACSQALFCLGIAQGSLFTLGKHNSFNYNHQKATCFIALLDGFTGVYAGFAIFSVLGFMAESTGKEVSELAVGGLGLSFIVFPEALSLMPFPWIWCIFFFMMMITIGFGSLLSMTECALDNLQSIAKVDKKYTIHLRICTCIFFFIMGISMCTRGGYYLLNLIDNYTCTIPIILLATLEAIGLGWFYGVKRIGDNIRLMLNTELHFYWKLCFRFLTPIIAIVMLVISLAKNSEVTLNKYVYPKWAHYFGHFVVITCLCPLILYMIKEMNKAGVFEIMQDLLNPSEKWKPVFDGEHVEDGASTSGSSNPSLNRDSMKNVTHDQEYTQIKLEKITEKNNQIVFSNNETDEE